MSVVAGASVPTGSSKKSARKKAKRVKETKWRIVLTGAIIVLVILSANPGIVDSLINGLNVNFSLSLPVSQAIDLKSYVTQNVGVPNYATNIVLQLKETRVSLGSSFSFHIEVSQAGATQAGTPYFYVVLNSPANQQYVFFPLASGWSFVSGKPSDWPSNGVLFECVLGPCTIPRQTFLSGRGSCPMCNVWNWSNYVWFRWDVPSNPTMSRSFLGVWTIYVFTYAGSYPSTPSANATNALGYTFDTFQIVPLSPAVSAWNTFESLALTSFSVVVAAVATWVWVSPWVEAEWKRIGQLKKRYLVLLILIILALTLNYFAWLASR